MDTQEKVQRVIATSDILKELRKAIRVFTYPEFKRESSEHRKLRQGIASQVKTGIVMENGNIVRFSQRNCPKNFRRNGRKLSRTERRVIFYKIILDKLRESAFHYSGK